MLTRCGTVTAATLTVSGLILSSALSASAQQRPRPYRSPTFPKPAPIAANCLHDRAETAEQAPRRREALTAARIINTVQAQQHGMYLDSAALLNRPELANFVTGQPNEIPVGWRLQLATTLDGYVFSLKDLTDPCRFAYFSDENGLIYTGEPIR